MRLKKLLAVTIFLISIAIAGCVDFGIRSRPAPVLNLGINSDSKTGAMIVRARDTLWRISKRYRLSMRSIIALNKIKSPYALSRGQRLKLPAPLNYNVKYGDTLYSIANMFDVSIYKMVRINRIKRPYVITVGQRLRIPSFSYSRPRSKRYIAKSNIHKRSKKSLTRRKYKLSRHKRSYGRIKNSRRPNFIWPVKGKIISRYGAKKGGLYNDGINIAVPKRTPVLSAADGTVAYIGDDLKSYGNLILIRHNGGGMSTAYAHLKTITVKKGQKVRKRQVIGLAGSTGSVSTPQLHFEIRKGAKTYNPVKYL